MRNLIKRWEEGRRVLEEASQLAEKGTLDSLLRFYQTGMVQDVHLPSLLTPYDHTVALTLAEQLMPILEPHNIRLKTEQLEESGEFLLYYQREEYRCYFAEIHPHTRSVSYNFDFDEMEREREIKISRLKTQRNEIYERYKDTQEYLKDTDKGLSRYKHRNMIRRLQESIKRLPDEIEEIEQDLKDINRNKMVMEHLQQVLPYFESDLRRYGFLFEAKKGADFEI